MVWDELSQCTILQTRSVRQVAFRMSIEEWKPSPGMDAKRESENVEPDSRLRTKR